jgi:hypothetical protein
VSPAGEGRAKSPPPPGEGQGGGADQPLPHQTHPDWLIRVPHEPGVPVVERSVGPVVAGGVVVVGSSVVGFAGLDAGTGAVRWRRPGERWPGPPVVHGPYVRLPGRCGEPRGACAPQVELATGRSVEPPVPQPAGAAPGADAIAADDAGVWRGDRWRLAFDEPVAAGLAGPVVAGDVVAWVRDDRLEAAGFGDGRPAWSADGRFAYVPGAIDVDARGDALRVISLAGGVGPARVDAADGRLLARGDTVAAIGVLAAALHDRGAVIAVRRDGSLRDDAVAAFDADGRLLWTWPLPRPQAPRVDPIGLAATGDAVFVFFDGRLAARLPLR